MQTRTFECKVCGRRQTIPGWWNWPAEQEPLCTHDSRSGPAPGEQSALPFDTRKRELTAGARVRVVKQDRNRGKVGTIAWVRMAAPSHTTVESASVVLDELRGSPGYTGSLYAPEDLEAI